jgi:hypothetical protein
MMMGVVVVVVVVVVVIVLASSNLLDGGIIGDGDGIEVVLGGGGGRCSPTLQSTPLSLRSSEITLSSESRLSNSIERSLSYKYLHFDGACEVDVLVRLPRLPSRGDDDECAVRRDDDDDDDDDDDMTT